MAADPLPPKEPSLAEKLATDAAAAAAQKTAESMVRGAVAAVGKAAGSALDAVETMLFGKVGGAEEAVAREAEADPMQRLRDQYGVETRTAPKKATEAEKLDEAKRQLEELKKVRGAQQATADAPPVERKRTL